MSFKSDQRWYDYFLPSQVESGALIPMELCVVAAGKIMKKELYQDKTREMVDFARMRPSDRFNDIRRGLDVRTLLSQQAIN